MLTQLKYKIVIDNVHYEADKAVLTGQEVLQLAGLVNSSEHCLFLTLENGDMEGIRPNEAVDLNRPGIERFKTFKTDAVYRFEINGEAREWGAPFITGRALKQRAGLDGKDGGVWQYIKGEDDRLIEDHDRVDLIASGIERFQTGEKYSICIEGKTHRWPKPTITPREIAQLGGWDITEGVVEIDKDQNERTLQPDEVIHLKSGLKFCKHQRFRRGFTSPRIEQEFHLLQGAFPGVTYQETSGAHWFCVPSLSLPPPLSPDQVQVAFSVTPAHPNALPYGFFVQGTVKHGDAVITTRAVPNQPPFEGSWTFFSWTPEAWNPGTTAQTGDNLWTWVRSFRNRLMEGA
jgi:hypothetical protein